MHSLLTNVVLPMIYRIPENSDLRESLNQPMLIGIINQFSSITRS
jgi:hypothetical protein